MSIIKLGERLLSVAVPTMEATANCGRCELRALNHCCPHFGEPCKRRFVLVDVCGNVCGHRCLYRPQYCGCG